MQPLVAIAKRTAFINLGNRKINKMNIFIVGSGKLANSILESGMTFSLGEVKKWDSKPKNFNEKSIIVHAGSGRQLKECVDFCKNTQSIFIELSTGLETENMSPEFPLIICPNTSILLLKAMAMIKNFGYMFQDYEISIIESHQSSKKSAPGTAYNFAKSLQIANGKIKSVRDINLQKEEIKIPEEYLGKHAYHKIIITDDLDEVTIETKVLGHSSYSKGVKQILVAVLKHNFEKKKYSVLDLIDKNWI